MAQTVRAWAEQARRMTREEFVRRFPGPFLVLLDVADPSGPQSAVTTGKLPALRRGQTAVVVARDGLLVHAVAKRSDGLSPFPTMITVGRAANNDIVLPSPEVSSFHAYFAQEGQGWVVRDADSTHGTFVAAQPVKGPTPIGPDTIIAFGGLRTRFLLGDGLYKLALFGQ